MVIMHSGCLEVYGITYTHQGYICFGILEAALTAPPSFGEAEMDKHRLDVPFGLISGSLPAGLFLHLSGFFPSSAPNY